MKPDWDNIERLLYIYKKEAQIKPVTSVFLKAAAFMKEEEEP